MGRRLDTAAVRRTAYSNHYVDNVGTANNGRAVVASDLAREAKLVRSAALRDEVQQRYDADGAGGIYQVRIAANDEGPMAAAWRTAAPSPGWPTRNEEVAAIAAEEAAREEADAALAQLERLPGPHLAAVLKLAELPPVRSADTLRQRLSVARRQQNPQAGQDLQHQIVGAAAIAADLLVHVDQHAINLLTADDDELLIEAERIAGAAQARHEGRLARGFEGIHPRERDAHSVRRRLRRHVGRAGLHASAILGLIGGPERLRRPSYVDNWSLDRWRGIQAKNVAVLAEREITAPGRDPINLADVAAGKKESDAARWYAITLGIQQEAKRRGWIPLFLTLTLPPEYHLHASNGERGDPALAPWVAAKEINSRWHDALSAAHQTDAWPTGVRIAEPHRDGCPHLHCCLWLDPASLPALLHAIDLHFPATTEDEAAARARGDYTQGPAVQLKVWEEDTERASPVSYVMTYVMKTLRAKGAPEGFDGDPDNDRAAAWASLIGARRISLVGLKPGTQARWQAAQRSIRAAENEPMRGGAHRIGGHRGRAIAHAMRKQRWGTALRLLGALAAEPRLLPERRERESCWGDTVAETRGYFHPETGELVFETRPLEWTIRKIERDAPVSKSRNDNELSVSVSFPRAAPAARPPAEPPPEPPWTNDPEWQIWWQKEQEELAQWLANA